MAKETYDPEKHKVFIILYRKNGPAMWVHPSKVKVFRSQGYKTAAEVEKLHNKWKRKYGIVDAPVNNIPGIDRHPETGDILDIE